MFEPLAGWLSPDRMKNGLTIGTGPKHRTEDSHGTVNRSRRLHEIDGNLDPAGRYENFAGQVRVRPATARGADPQASTVCPAGRV